MDLGECAAAVCGLPNSSLSGLRGAIQATNGDLALKW